MMRLDETIGDFAVNSTIPFGVVDIIEVFSEEGKDYWYVYMDLYWR